MWTMRIKIYGLSLCSGIGGLELGLRLAIGPRYQTLCYVERDAYAAATLVDRMESKALDPAPIWDLLETFRGGPWSASVDIVTAGFPCQPVSCAGSQAGQNDDRWLWPDVARVLREVEPSVVVLENVPGLLVRGFGDVLRDLAELGFDAEWDVFSAQAGGAPHIRRRVFLVGRRVAGTTSRHPFMANTYRGGFEVKRWENREQGLPRWREPDGRGEDVPNTNGEGRTQQGNRGGDEGEDDRPGQGQEVGPVAGSDQGAGWWATEPEVGRVADGVPSRLDRLHCLGNAVVPRVAANAFLTLMERFSAEQYREVPGVVEK